MLSKVAGRSEVDAMSVHPEIQDKKPQFQHNMYQECGFLYLISGRGVAHSGIARSVMHHYTPK
eukprot:2332883-Rhodomonas_salina.4